FQASLELAARQQHAVLTGAATQADVGAEPYDRPIAATARVWFSKAHHVSNVNFDETSGAHVAVAFESARRDRRFCPRLVDCQTQALGLGAGGVLPVRTGAGVDHAATGVDESAAAVSGNRGANGSRQIARLGAHARQEQRRLRSQT